ncbi:hypothetical protein GC209_08235 [bacterium]|nr:hypothetical protein [bacterium]
MFEANPGRGLCDAASLWRKAMAAALPAGLILTMAALAARADTPVERGDVLYVSVAGAPDMTREAKVDADGRIRLPILGGIDVAGVDVDEIQRRIEAALVARDIVLSPVVLVEVSSYRPIYIGGAVRTSGEVPYQPGLTVRQAIIAAGGLDALPGTKAAAPGDVAELLARRQAAILDLASSDSEIARLKAQLGDAAMPQPAAPDPRPEVDATLSVDRDLLGALTDQRKSDASYADTAVALLQLELDVLTQQGALQAKERDLQHQDVENTRVMVEKGLVPLPRLNDLQREESRLSRDLLENSAFAARARQDIASIRHQNAAADAAARITWLEEYRKALQTHAALEAEIDITNGRLLTVGSLSAVPGQTAEPVPELLAHRRLGGQASVVRLTLDDEVQPGDVIDVKLPELPRS